MATSVDRVSAQSAAPAFGRLVEPVVDFIHVGVQKAGSSWLQQALSRHPELFTGCGSQNDKDICFFSYHYDRGYEWYERHFTEGRAARMRGEVSTSYFPCRDAPGRIARYNPRMKILVCLRNPVDRLISNHLHEIRLGHVSERNYDLADGIRNNPAYLEQSRYYTLLKRWLREFSMENLHVTIFEHLFEAPEVHLGAIYRFLGIASEPSSDFPTEAVNARRVPVSRTFDLAARRSARLLKGLVPAGAIRSLKRAGIHKAATAANTRADPERLVDRALRLELHQLFEDENAALADLLGIDLGIWSP
ncbi:MAG: sulfotransferase family protein [Pseudomonadales bacterium]